MSNIECLLRYATSIEDCKTIYALYSSSSISFNKTQKYTIVEMMHGFGYQTNSFSMEIEEILETLKIEDKTDLLTFNLHKFKTMALLPEERISTLKDYMLNPEGKYSAADIETFSSGFTSRFLPKEVKREYYDVYFDNLLDSIGRNPNMYIKVVTSYEETDSWFDSYK